MSFNRTFPLCNFEISKGSDMVHTNNNTTYYINPSLLTFQEDSGYGANLIQVSASSSCYIRVFIPGVIGYDSDGNYRKYKVTAYNNKFPDNSRFYIYIRLERDGAAGLVVYSKYLYEVDGSCEETGAGASDTYYYIRIGEVSATDGKSIREISYDTGRLESDQVYNEGTQLNEMWELDKHSTPWLIRAKQWLSSFTVKGFITLVGGFVFRNGNTEKTVDDIKRSTDSDEDVPVSDSSLATSGYVESEIEKLEDRFISKEHDDETPYNLGVGKNLSIGGNTASKDFASGTVGGGYATRRNNDGKYESEADIFIARVLAKVYDLLVENNSIFKGDLSSEEFVSGFLSGKGWSIRMKEWLNASGETERKSVAEFDELVVRGAMRVYEFIVSQLLGENDNRVFTGMMEVDHYDAATGRIYLKTDNGKLYNPFRADDVVIVQQYGEPNQDNGFYVTKEYELIVSEAQVGDTSNGEDRLDWITFSNFTTPMEGGDESMIAERDTLVRIDNLTNPDRKGIIQMMSAGKDTPYMDFIYGRKTDPDNSLKGRLGNLGGISNQLFDNVVGFGAYLTNLYAVGEFYIRHTGENVSDTIEIAKGQFRTNFRQTTYDLSDEDNFFTNAALTNNCEHWILGSEEGTGYFMVDGLPQFFNFDVYATEDSYAGLVEWKGRDMLRLNKSSARQLNPLIRKPGTHRVYGDAVLKEDGTFADNYEEVPDTLYLTVRLFAAGTGNVELGFVGEDGTFIGNDFHIAREVEADEDAYDIKVAGTWDGLGDFCITSTGDVYVDLLSLTDKPLENFRTETWSAIEQASEKISLTAGRVQASSGTLADLTVKYDEITGQVSSLQDQFGVTQKDLEDFQAEAKEEFESLSADVAGLDGWKTGLENAGLTSTLIQQTGDTVSIVAGSFEKDKDGKYVLTSAAGSLVYAEAEKAINEQFATLDGKYAKVETSVQYDPETHEITSDVRISADNIKLEADKMIEIINKEGTISVEAARLDLNGAITANGTFKIDTDGTMTCTGGTIGGFHISGNNLTNEGRNNDASVIFVNTETGCIAAMGGNIIPFETGATGVALFQNHKKDESGLIANYAAIFSSKGTHDNVAIDIEGGAVQGFAMRNTIVNSTFKTLFRNDYNVVCINSSDCEITLPAMKLAEDGHVVRIKRLGSGGVKVKMQNCETFAKESSRPVMYYDSNDVKVGEETIAFPNKGDACEFVWVRDLINTIDGTTYYGAWVQYKFPRSW